MNKLNLSWKQAYAGLLLCAATAITLQAQEFETLVYFNGPNGATPLYTSLVQGTDGDLYGTTRFGGAYNQGTIFRITGVGNLTTLYSFCSQTGCNDGINPYAGLVAGSDGSFYGTTFAGGEYGCGTVFKITAGGTLTTLHSFDYADGYKPSAALLQSTDGNFYGTTYAGGASEACSEGCGTVFKITPSGTLTTLLSFDSSDGAAASAALVQGPDANFYGTTSEGGTSSACTLGCGTVFKITPQGKVTTLHSFEATDGWAPYAALAQAPDGNFYGTTYGPTGTIFKVTPGGTLTTLHAFDQTDGAYPYAPLVRATDGDFYGTTFGGGASGWGTVFKITPTGTLTTLHSFDPTEGTNPYGGLVEATGGTFYGTASGGGFNDEGTVFGLSIGLGPFVETLPTSGKVEKPVIILGTNLTGATSVTFNGTAATFRVVSKSAISTTVPAGATTGTVQVVTPSGTLSSNVPFRVAP